MPQLQLSYKNYHLCNLYQNFCLHNLHKPFSRQVHPERMYIREVQQGLYLKQDQKVLPLHTVVQEHLGYLGNAQSHFHNFLCMGKYLARSTVHSKA